MKSFGKLLAITTGVLLLLGRIAPSVQAQRFDKELTSSVNSINKQVMPDMVTEAGSEGVMKYVTNILGYLAPVVIALGLVVAFFGTYKMMSSEDPSKMKD